MGKEMTTPLWFTNPNKVLTEQDILEMREYERIREEQEASSN
jgi:hypothetical protein